jgi:putative hydrolase of the HAD superfamily
LPIWNDIFFITEKNQAVYNLAEILRGRYKIALLSNINILHFCYLKKNFPVFDAFHHIITSFELGFRKPHPAIYKLALGALETLPQQTFYTDDRTELIQSAQELGIKSFVFRGITQLETDLKSQGIKIN